MRMIHAEGLSAFPLGRLGENEATTVVFHVAKWREAFGEGTFVLLNRRSGDVAAYPCVIEQSGDEVRWQVKSADLAVAGYGQCELIYTVGSTVVKSEIFKTFVETALSSGADVPEPWEDWVQEVLDAADRVELATMGSIPTALAQLSDDASHRFVSDEEKAAWDEKQDAIFDLSDIRSGASLGATALQTAPVVSVNGQTGTVSVNEVPADGMTDQVLTKTASGYSWADAHCGGDGDMSTSVYDPTGKQQDIFAYADAAAASVVVPTALSQLGDDSSHRLVSDWEKSTWSSKQPQHTAQAVTLAAADWENGQQMVSAAGVTTSNTVIVSPAPTSTAVYGEMGIYCSAQGAGTLTFSCDTVPTASITVNMAIFD